MALWPVPPLEKSRPRDARPQPTLVNGSLDEEKKVDENDGDAQTQGEVVKDQRRSFARVTRLSLVEARHQSLSRKPKLCLCRHRHYYGYGSSLVTCFECLACLSEH